MSNSEHANFDDLKISNKEDVKKLKKLESNAVKKVKERQRRSKMTETIQELRSIIPTCAQEKKLNQSLVMSNAVEYILLLKSKVRELEEENRRMKEKYDNIAKDHEHSEMSLGSDHSSNKNEMSLNDNIIDDNIPPHPCQDGSIHDNSTIHNTHDIKTSTPIKIKEEDKQMIVDSSYLDVFPKYDYNQEMMPDIFVNDIEEVGVWPLYPHASSVGSESKMTMDSFNLVDQQPFVYCECGKMCQNHATELNDENNGHHHHFNQHQGFYKPSNNSLFNF